MSTTSLPSWTGKLPTPNLSVPIADSPFSAPGWREVGVAYSAIPDALNPPDLAVLEAIRNDLFPEAVYVRKLWTFKSPHVEGKEYNLTFMRHCIASRIVVPKTEKIVFQVDGCRGWEDTPNQLDVVLMCKPGAEYCDLPGEYLPFSWATYHHLRVVMDENSARERVYKYITKKVELLQAQKFKNKLEYERMQATAVKEFQKRLEAISDVELAEYFREMKRIQKQRQIDFYTAIRKAEESKPLWFAMNGNRKGN